MKTISNRRLLKEIRKSVEMAKKDDNLLTLAPRIRTLIEGIVLYLERRRKRK